MNVLYKRTCLYVVRKKLGLRDVSSQFKAKVQMTTEQLSMNVFIGDHWVRF